MGRALALALAAALVGAVPGYALGRLGARRAGLILAAALAAGAGYMLVTARGQPGMEGMARLIFALFMLGPAAAGSGLGLWLGLRGRRRRSARPEA